jgi:hypothetical protein
MKIKKFNIAILIIFILSFQSCRFIGEIFKAGMGFGIFIVVAIIVVILLIRSRIEK